MKPLAGKLILLVEDNESMAYALRKLLELEGAEVHVASESNVIEKDQSYDAIVADWSSVRDADLPLPAPTIYTTGNLKDDPSTDRPHLRPVVYKPFDCAELVQAILLVMD